MKLKSGGPQNEALQQTKPGVTTHGPVFAAERRCSADSSWARTAVLVLATLAASVGVAGPAIASEPCEPFKDADENLLARGWWCSHGFRGPHGARGCAWSVTVLKDGMVEVRNAIDEMKSARYRLTTNQLAIFRATIDRERPWEIRERLGTLYQHGPERHIEVVRDETLTCYHLFSTPQGLHAVYEDSPDPLPRALRFCEALWELARDPELPGCVVER